MACKYCRVYSWPYKEDRFAVAKAFYGKAVSSSNELELPCNVAVFLGYEDKEYPFVSIALDMDYGVVANSETSAILDKFVERFGEPRPQSLENGSWFDSVDKNYKATLENYGVTLYEGVLWEGRSTPLDDHSIRQEWKHLHEQCLAEVDETQPDADALTKFNQAIAKSTNAVREKYGLSKDRMLAIIRGDEASKNVEPERDTSNNADDILADLQKVYSESVTAYGETRWLFAPIGLMMILIPAFLIGVTSELSGFVGAIIGLLAFLGLINPIDSLVTSKDRRSLRQSIGNIQEKYQLSPDAIVEILLTKPEFNSYEKSPEWFTEFVWGEHNASVILPRVKYKAEKGEGVT